MGERERAQRWDGLGKRDTFRALGQVSRVLKSIVFMLNVVPSMLFIFCFEDPFGFSVDSTASDPFSQIQGVTDISDKCDLYYYITLVALPCTCFLHADIPYSSSQSFRLTSVLFFASTTAPAYPPVDPKPRYIHFHKQVHLGPRSSASATRISYRQRQRNRRTDIHISPTLLFTTPLRRQLPSRHHQSSTSA